MSKRKIIIEKNGYPCIELYSVQVKAKTRKLKAQWSPKLAQDLQGFISFDHASEIEKKLNEKISYKRVLLIEKRRTQIIDIENKLVSLLSQEIAKSIDQKIMNQIMIEHGF